MTTTPRIIFHVGGPSFHPVEPQAKRIIAWLGDGHDCGVHDGVDAFDGLDDCDLLVLMGLHWSGLSTATDGELAYRPMSDRHKKSFERYVASGRPILAHHGSIASYDDWPRFGDLVGFAWVWGSTSHSPIELHRIQVLETGHPVVAGVRDYALVDELYYKIKITDGFEPEIHAVAQWDDVAQPMVMTGYGGRAVGAGKVAYLANGHDLRAFECSQMRQLWLNAVEWLLRD